MVKKIAIINIYNFIRKTVYPSGNYVKEELDTVLYEIEEVKKYGLPGTYALKYDALMDENYINLLNDNLDENDEIGGWFEIDKTLAENAGVRWKGESPVDDHVNKGYSLAYTPEERIRMIDVYMRDFKGVFGYYPKSIGAWVIDIATLRHCKDAYGVIGAAICRDQIGTDGFTLWGGYYNQGYYPSIFNEYIPAQSKENQLDLPIFRLLGPDPIYAFEDGLRKSVAAVYTLEPAATIAQDEKWIKWYFERMIEEENLGFSYGQTGQENTFLWNTMSKGYRIQMKYIASLAENNSVRVETLSESAAWYKKKYYLTAVSTIVATKDWNIENSLKTLWYNSRFFRVGLLSEDSRLRIRDLFIFDENYKSRYYDDILVEEESTFDALPILDAHRWSIEEDRAYIKFVKIKSDGEIKELIGKKVDFQKIDEDIYVLSWILECGRTVKIICREHSIEIFLDKNFHDGKIALRFNKLPVLSKLYVNKLICKHNNFSYSIAVEKSICEKLNDKEIIIKAMEKSIVIGLKQNESLKDIDFINKNYKRNKEEIDNYIPYYKRNIIEKKFIPRAIKPQIVPRLILNNINENGVFRIDNVNSVGKIFYTLDGSEPTIKSTLYEKPIMLNKECTIKSKIYGNQLKESEVSEGNFYQSMVIDSIVGITEPVKIKRYNPKGVQTLIDRRKGTEDYRDGSWLGYYNDLDVIVNLGEIKEINKITIGFLQDTRAWIYYPKYVIFQYSIDNKEFIDFEYVDCEKDIKRREISVSNIDVIKNIKCKYIRIFAKNQEFCPYWSIMPGEGPAFLFADQITIL